MKLMVASSTEYYFLNYLIWIAYTVAASVLAAFFIHFLGPNAAGTYEWECLS